MADPTHQQIIQSAQGHVEMYESSIGRREFELYNGLHQIDVWTTAKWWRYDTAELESWRKALDQARRAAVVVEPLVP